MNVVYVVLRNGIVDEVFTNRPAAELHAKNLIKTWSLVSIVEKELKEL